MQCIETLDGRKGWPFIEKNTTVRIVLEWTPVSECVFERKGWPFIEKNTTVRLVLEWTPVSECVFECSIYRRNPSTMAIH